MLVGPQVSCRPGQVSQNSQPTDFQLEKIKDDLRKSACKCSDAGGQQCTAQFTVGNVLDLRVARRDIGYSGETLLRQQELKDAIQRQAASGGGKLKFFVEGKLVCQQAYSVLFCVPKSSGTVQQQRLIPNFCSTVSDQKPSRSATRSKSCWASSSECSNANNNPPG
jgi:hypothetical protein